MIDLYLKFTDEAEAASILYTLHPEAVEADGVTVTEAYTTPNYQNIDTLGVIYQPVGEFNEETGQASEALPGWHVNVRVVGDEDPTPLEQYAVHPTVPRRIWG